MTDIRSDSPITGVLRLRLDGPSTLNALDEDAKAALIEALVLAESDPGVRVIVLTGTGRAFCAGGDVRAMGERTAVDTIDVLDRGNEIIERLTSSSKVVIAGVNGLASGAGFNLALACDMLVAAPQAWFQQSFVRIGLAPDMGGSYLLAQAIGMHRAKRALLTGDRISSARALEMGFVGEVVEGDFDARLLELAAELARQPPRAIAVTKQLVSQSVSGTLADALARESLAQAVLSTTDDHRRAARAFQAKEDLARVEFHGR